MDTSPFALWRWADTFSHIDIFISGFGTTLLVSFLALCIAVIMGVFHALLATSKFTILKLWARVYVEFFQNTPSETFSDSNWDRRVSWSIYE